MSGIGGMVAQGMMFGAGSAIAHKAIDGVMGGSEGGEDDGQVNQQEQSSTSSRQATGPCGENKNMLYQCLETQAGSASACQYYFDSLAQCQEQMKN